MNKEEFIKICNEYYGNFKETDDEIIFYANNTLEHSHNEEQKDGSVKFITRKRKIYCELSLRNNNLYGEEATCEIIGGFGNAIADEENLRYYLQRYNFVEKDFIPLF